MRIDPVFLVAPEPEPPSMPTRRAFLIAAGALVVGAGGGGACGYSMGKAAGVAEAAQEKPSAGPERISSGDAQLDAWRDLAVRAPIDELFAKALPFLHARGTDYPQDQVLWQGVERMVAELRDQPTRVVDEVLLALLAGVIEGPAHPQEPSLRNFVPMLRERRQALRRPR